MSILLLILPLITISVIWVNSTYSYSTVSGISKYNEGAPVNTYGTFKKEQNKIIYGLIGTIINLLITILFIITYDSNTQLFQFIFKLNDIAILGLDSISLWLIFLVNLIIPIVILHSWKEINNLGHSAQKQFLILVLLVNFGSIAVFLVLDILLFYISFEMVLIPMYYLIGYYGSRNKKIERAQNMLFIYTVFGSLFLLIGILIIYMETGSTDYQTILMVPIQEDLQLLLFLLFLISFLVKTPTFPFHTWLPMAHGESSTGTSVILAAILLKFATYGYIRYTIPILPYASKFFIPLIFTLSIISIIYACILAFSLIDIKVLIAYSSVIHMNVSNIGIFSNDLQGLTGAYAYSISHGLISGGLFLLVGILYSRYHTKNIKYYRGLFLIMPKFVLFLFLFNLSNLSFPLSLGFLAENLILVSSLEISPLITILISLACLLLPITMFWIYQKISFGRISNHFTTLYLDLNIKEYHLLLPLIVISTIFGIYPYYLFDSLVYPLLSIIY